MSCLCDDIKSNKETILVGEIGVLLHDIGKLHPDFIGKNSIENYPKKFYHSRIDEFLKSELLNDIKDKKFEITVDSDTTNIYKLITEHHNEGTSDKIVKLLIKCDRKDSADDKGIVRKGQSIENTIIASPFGYPKEKIDLNCLQKRFNDLEDNLIGLFKNYISGTMSLSHFRESLINNLKTSFSHALGETRIPANDVTLWDHSYSTASLFKTVLAARVCGASSDPNNLKWRIFGVCWNGVEFINKGRKIAEIQTRSEIIENVKKKLKRKFEDEIPIGNAIYEDTNGIYFTFPDLADNKLKDFAKECADESLKIIYEESDNELWPFFTLSKASRTLTIIAGELEFASKKRRIPKISPTLFVEGKEESFFENPEIATPVEGQDICPVCRIRPKDEKKERCDICEERRKGRLLQWLSNRQDTIWVNEVADKNNRIALISLNFNLDKWLDGTMVGTIYSQSFEDWKSGQRYKKKATQNILKNTTIKQTGNPKEDALNIAKWITENQSKTEVKTLLECFMENGNADNIPDDIKNNSNKILSWFFTQNPSPARLYRIWRETEEFFDLVIEEIKDEIYSNRWKRIKFSVDYTNLKLKQGKGMQEGTPYIVQIDNLNPQNLVVFHNKNGEFYTIESLGKFKFNDKTGEEAVEETLKQGFGYLATEDKPSENLLNSDDKTVGSDTLTEEYCPLIEINRSPLSLRLIAPALDSIKIIELVTKLYNERFKKVLGKLPLNVKLLVAKRKFPLYILLDAENRMLEGEEFKSQVKMNPWWDTNGMRNDRCYGFYPIKLIKENEKYTLDDLSSVSKGKIFSLYPGYFDFDLLLGTTDRYSIYYKGRKRGSEDYKLFTGRPYYFYQISEMLELWDVLLNLSSSQINFIEEMFATKLREWRNVNDSAKDEVMRNFVNAILKDAFSDKWDNLREETKSFLMSASLNGLLLDTIVLFNHTTKFEEVGENGS